MTPARPRINRLFRFQWEPAQQAHVLLYPEGMVKLNQSAGEILKRCDGSRNTGEVIADLDASFPGTPDAIAAGTRSFIAVAREKGWLLG